MDCFESCSGRSWQVDVSSGREEVTETAGCPGILGGGESLAESSNARLEVLRA